MRVLLCFVEANGDKACVAQFPHVFLVGALVVFREAAMFHDDGVGEIALAATPQAFAAVPAGTVLPSCVRFEQSAALTTVTSGTLTASFGTLPGKRIHSGFKLFLEFLKLLNLSLAIHCWLPRRFMNMMDWMWSGALEGLAVGFVLYS